MKTRPEIEVFTDKDHCESHIDKVCCDFITIRDRKNFCSVYREYLEGCDLRKCDQCKVDYNKAKQRNENNAKAREYTKKYQKQTIQQGKDDGET